MCVSVFIVNTHEQLGGGFQGSEAAIEESEECRKGMRMNRSRHLLKNMRRGVRRGVRRGRRGEVFVDGACRYFVINEFDQTSINTQSDAHTHTHMYRSFFSSARGPWTDDKDLGKLVRLEQACMQSPAGTFDVAGDARSH